MKKANGVKKNVIEKHISHYNCVYFLFEVTKFMHTMQSMRSFKHQLYSVKHNKVSL